MTTVANNDKTAVLLMAYGTPRTPDEIEPYYTDIRRGRPPTPELLAELTARYDAIGGISPST
jgi:ferrochelatase